jgi:hypothetical protein
MLQVPARQCEPVVQLEHEAPHWASVSVMHCPPHAAKPELQSAPQTPAMQMGEPGPTAGQTVQLEPHASGLAPSTQPPLHEKSPGSHT